MRFLLFLSLAKVVFCYNLTVSKGTQVYFLTNGTADDLSQIKVTAEKSKIDTNVLTYSIPQSDGSLNPLLITEDDTYLQILKPDGNPAQVTVYRNSVTKNLNVFPVFENSSIAFKSGLNVFFAVDRPAGKILTVNNFKSAKSVQAYTGVPGDENNFIFFNTSIYPETTVYQKLDIPRLNFFFDTVDSDVEYQVSFGEATVSNLMESGLLMTDSYPFTNYVSDRLYMLPNAGSNIRLDMKPFFYNSLAYTTYIQVSFSGGSSQGTTFSSGFDGKLEAEGAITQVEISAGGGYSIQYSTQQLSGTKSLESTTTIPVSTTTTIPVSTTTSSASVYVMLFSIVITFLNIFLEN